MVENKESQLEETLLNSFRQETFYGSGDRNRFLGELPERVILWLSKEEVREKGIYPEVVQVLQRQHEVKLILDQGMKELGSKYLDLAGEYKKRHTLVSNPKFIGEVGLVLVSNEAVDRPLQRVVTRKRQLLEKGIPESIINHVGEALCGDAYEKLEKLAPEDIENYRRQCWLDKLLGKGCIPWEECKKKS